MKLGLVFPLGKGNIILQHFGENKVPLYKNMGMNGHNGLDMSAHDGETIYASHDGIVTFTGEDGSGGLGVVIRTNQQFEYKDSQSFFKTIYWHCLPNSFLVKPTESVIAGQPIAQADNTGASTGTHLHFGLKPIFQGEQDWQWMNLEQNNGYFGSIDPEPYLVGPLKFKYTFNYDMVFGEEDDEVRNLQIALSLLGFFNTKPTGFYGKITAQAIKNFLMANNISASGKIAGPKTRSLLNKIFS